jgi:hypothetical protein
MEKKILQTLLWFATILLQFFHALFSRLLEKLQGFLTKKISDIARASLKPELRWTGKRDLQEEGDINAVMRRRVHQSLNAKLLIL